MKKSKVKTPIFLRIIRFLFPIMEKILPRLTQQFAFELFFSPFRFKAPERELHVMDAAIRFQIEVKGKKIQCYAWGKGPVVLMVHGWSGRASQFYKFIPAFVSSGYKVVSFDGPAHGLSDGKSTNILEFQDVLHQLEELNKPLAGIVTHSFGGYATMWAVCQGLQVRNIININSPSHSNFLLEDYLKTINGSNKTKQAFLKKIQQRFGKDFSDFSTDQIAHHLPALNLFLIHDEDDQSVEKEQTLKLNKLIKGSSIMLTSGLGHNRILGEISVVMKCIHFIDQHQYEMKPVDLATRV